MQAIYCIKDGFIKACETQGITIDKSKDVITLNSINDINADLPDEIQKGKYNCICCINDLVAFSIQQRLDDQSIIISGFDNSPIRKLCLDAPVSISLPVKKLGNEAGKWIGNRIINKKEAAVQKKIAGQLIK